MLYTHLGLEICFLEQIRCRDPGRPWAREVPLRDLRQRRHIPWSGLQAVDGKPFEQWAGSWRPVSHLCCICESSRSIYYIQVLLKINLDWNDCLLLLEFQTILGWTFFMDWATGWCQDPKTLDQAIELEGMRKYAGNNTQEWGFDAIFDVKCTKCGNSDEFFKDEIKRNGPPSKKLVWGHFYIDRQWKTPYTSAPKRKSEFLSTKRHSICYTSYSSGYLEGIRLILSLTDLVCLKSSLKYFSLFKVFGLCDDVNILCPRIVIHR